MSDEGNVFTGGCLCGAIRYRAEGPPKRVTICHCSTCRRAGGGAFLTAAAFDPAKLVYTKGEPKGYASSAQLTRTFCPECGTPLGYRYTDGEAAGVWTGTLDDPEALKPMRHIWTSSQLSWLHLEDDLPRFAQGAARPDAKA